MTALSWEPWFYGAVAVFCVGLLWSGLRGVKKALQHEDTSDKERLE